MEAGHQKARLLKPARGTAAVADTCNPQDMRRAGRWWQEPCNLIALVGLKPKPSCTLCLSCSYQRQCGALWDIDQGRLKKPDECGVEKAKRQDNGQETQCNHSNFPHDDVLVTIRLRDIRKCGNVIALCHGTSDDAGLDRGIDVTIAAEDPEIVT